MGLASRPAASSSRGRAGRQASLGLEDVPGYATLSCPRPAPRWKKLCPPRDLSPGLGAGSRNSPRRKVWPGLARLFRLCKFIVFIYRIWNRINDKREKAAAVLGQEGIPEPGLGGARSSEREPPFQRRSPALKSAGGRLCTPLGAPGGHGAVRGREGLAGLQRHLHGVVVADRQGLQGERGRGVGGGQSPAWAAAPDRCSWREGPRGSQRPAWPRPPPQTRKCLTSLALSLKVCWKFSTRAVPGRTASCSLPPVTTILHHGSAGGGEGPGGVQRAGEGPFPPRDAEWRPFHTG